MPGGEATQGRSEVPPKAPSKSAAPVTKPAGGKQPTSSANGAAARKVPRKETAEEAKRSSADTKAKGKPMPVEVKSKKPPASGTAVKSATNAVAKRGPAAEPKSLSITTKSSLATAPATSAAKETARASGVSSWTAGAGSGNVLAWLSQKTSGASVPQSKGAIEYLSQMKNEKAAGAEVAGPLRTPTPAPMPNAIQRLAEMLPQVTTAGPTTPAPGGVSVEVGKQPDAADARSWRSVTLAGLTTAPATAVPVAAAGASATAPAGDTAAVTHSVAKPAPTASMDVARPRPQAPVRPWSKDDGVTGHHLRGKRRQPQQIPQPRHKFQDPHQQAQQERMQREFERMALEAREKHEEALRTDPEYKKKFNTFQELQAAQQVAQNTFFERYRQQHSINIGVGMRERLDIPVILDLVEKHDVVFICTDTGSGKSTLVPKALLELSPDTRVVSTQPRRTATVSVATRVADLRRENVGEDVGYWIRGEKKGDDQTRLWYMTSYTLLLHLLSHPMQPPFTHIVLDEFHERQPDVEVIAALLKLCLRRRTATFKLVIMSATLNTEDWEEYFTGLSVASYKQSEPEHPIHDYFIEDVCALVGMEYVETHGLLHRSVDSSTIEKHCFIAQNLITYLNMYAVPIHSILVFLPGRAQVEQFQLWLEQSMQGRVDVIPWHSSVELSVIEEAIARCDPRRQKVYLATDIAEVSITIPDVVFVIDLVLVKRPKISMEQPASILYPPLVTQWISKGSVAQRRGRIGRVQQGFYFCLLPSAIVVQLPDYAQPPIENSRVDELSLHCLQVVSNPVAIFSICHGQPLLETIKSAMNELSHLGCIINSNDPLAQRERIAEIHANDTWNKAIMAEATELVQASIDQYDYTFIGRLLQLIPVSPQPGMLVFFGFLTGLESLMILAAAVTSSLSPFSTNPMDHQRGRRHKHDFVRAMEETENVMRDMCCGLRSDIVAIMKAVLMFRVRSVELGSGSLSVRQWCQQHYLSYDKLVAILDLESHVKNELANFIPFRDVIDPQQLLDQLEGIAPMVMVMTNVAFAAQSVVVTSNGNTYSSSREGAIGIFSDLTSVPDLHSPSCLRWQEGDIIIPVQISLHFSKMLVSFSTAIASHKQFWMSLLLFSHRLKYATFSDDDGVYHVFGITYCGVQKFIEADEATGYAVLQFRELLSSICATLRLQYSHKDMFDDEFAVTVLQRHGLKPLEEQQREAITLMVSRFFSNIDAITAVEVEHDENDLDLDSLLSFELKPEQ